MHWTQALAFVADSKLDDYRVGERYTLGIAPSKVIHISLLQGKIGVYFEDGTRMVRGYEPLSTELYYNPIKEEEE